MSVFTGLTNISIYVMISVGLTGWQASQLWHKNFNIAIFSDTINVINVKLCMMVLLIVPYLFIPLSVT